MERVRADIAIYTLLRDLGATVDEPISIYKIGEPLIMIKGYSQDDVLNGLLYLQSRKVIDLIDDNRLRLRQPIE